MHCIDDWYHNDDYVDDYCVQKIIVIDTMPPVCTITGPVEEGGRLVLRVVSMTSMHR